MMPGMRNFNPQQMGKMMRSMGIKNEELDVKRVVFELADKNLVIEQPNVSVIDMQGQKTYTVMGEAREEQAGVPEEDVKMVAESAEVSKDEAREALEESEGDIAKAITALKK